MNQKLTPFIISLIISCFFPSIAKAQSTLEDIRQTGILKVGIRKDAAPFGYLEGSQWKGLCLELSEVFRANLEQKLNRSVQLEKLETSLNESTEQGRYRSVAKGRIHLECGPNTIRKNPPSGTTYSDPFFFTGTYLLMPPDNRILFKTSGFLQDLTIGVLQDSLTQKFIESRYQLATAKVYDSVAGREMAVKDAMDGTIDAFASDGVLLIGEALRQGLTPQQYSLIPDHPLTCVSYGMILPVNDAEWKQTINQYLLNPSQQRTAATQQIVNILEKMFGADSPYLDVTVVASDQCGSGGAQ